jgi:hypothetical protein
VANIVFSGKWKQVFAKFKSTSRNIFKHPHDKLFGFLNLYTLIIPDGYYRNAKIRYLQLYFIIRYFYFVLIHGYLYHYSAVKVINIQYNNGFYICSNMHGRNFLRISRSHYSKRTKKKIVERKREKKDNECWTKYCMHNWRLRNTNRTKTGRN